MQKRLCFPRTQTSEYVVTQPDLELRSDQRAKAEAEHAETEVKKRTVERGRWRGRGGNWRHVADPDSKCEKCESAQNCVLLPTRLVGFVDGSLQPDPQKRMMKVRYKERFEQRLERCRNWGAR